ncbi:crotonase/enoyl-CoA hydratase family protein [Pseudomonas sp. BN605]|uniref:Enoyl-CoA hydratase n=1 Tax=Pseudomonas hunanensis TaxID=1247546 RepID=A0ABD6NBM5_9PSED|nr:MULTISPECIES: crotonase/enoyl-CoA hydratase family protein [Pseudomonas]MDH4847941.1 crotonase/enoyl-CoA hydratase family protein [Pseudomonas sp. BN605]NWL45630.1 enoyl-CoA hydratase [Pseudomonas hunanensis]
MSSDEAVTNLVDVVIEDNIATVTLKRAHKRNALNLALLHELQSAFSSLPSTVKVAILTGDGAHFSAGLDLSELKESTAAEGIHSSMIWYEAFHKIQFGRIPVIGLLHGAVVGGGLELAASLHVRVAEADTYFALPEGQRGIFLGGGGSVRITKLIGFSRVTEMMLTGNVLDADEGHLIGLAHYVTEKGQGMKKAKELAEKIAQNAPLSNFAILNALPLIAEQPMSHGLFTEALMASVTQSDPEAKERVNAFLQKRASKVTPV